MVRTPLPPHHYNSRRLQSKCTHDKSIHASKHRASNLMEGPSQVPIVLHNVSDSQKRNWFCISSDKKKSDVRLGASPRPPFCGLRWTSPKLPDCPKICENVSNYSDLEITRPMPGSQNWTSWSHTDDAENTYKTITCRANVLNVKSASPCPNHWINLIFCVNRWSPFYFHVRFL